MMHGRTPLIAECHVVEAKGGGHGSHSIAQAAASQSTVLAAIAQSRRAVRPRLTGETRGRSPISSEGVLNCIEPRTNNHADINVLPCSPSLSVPAAMQVGQVPSTSITRRIAR